MTTAALNPVVFDPAAFASGALARIGAIDFASHRGAMLRFARRKIRDEDLAEDAVQDALVAALAALTAFRSGAQHVLMLAGVVLSLVILQVFCGFANLLLLAPVWLQLVHLLLADSLWIAVVLLASAARDPVAAAVTARAPALALVPRKG